MFAYITTLYFIFLFWHYYRRNGLDISCCIVSVYLLSSVGSIYLLENNIEYSDKQPSFIPTVIYCSMITLVSWPFYKFNSNKIRNIQKLDIRYFDIMSWMFILSFIFCIVLFYKDIIFRFSLGDQIGQLRGIDNNVETAQAKLTGVLRFLSTFTVSICSMSAVAFIMFAYSVTFLNKPLWFNILLLLSSTGCIISGILNIDRSIIVYWLMNLIFIFFMFRPYLSKRFKRILLIIAGLIIWGASIYLVNMTLSRFGDSALDSVFDYMGQSYLNFCWFWDNYNAPVRNWGLFCPVISHFFIDWGFPVGAMSFGFFVEDHVGYFVNLFYTFMGTVMLYLGQWAVIPFCIIYTLITKNINNTKSIISLQKLIYIFILSIVPYDGVILYILVDYIKAFGIIVIICLCYAMREQGIKIKLIKNN